MAKPIRDLQSQLDALGIKQEVAFDEAMALLNLMHGATGRSVWPELSGNDVCVFANLVVARAPGKSTLPLIMKALNALRHHTEQTRPIERTTMVIDELTAYLEKKS